ncbi:MAG: hypothetical protein EA417_10490 [Gammaproteobacteria bacterium]|nr:MAG: hypothetical protein EA417_10490 [Gammaproteobacteria bacterium]
MVDQQQAVRNIAKRFAPVLAEVEQLSRVGETFLDKDVYCIYLATLWSNAVMEPERAGLETSELEIFYDFLNAAGQDILGGEEPVKDSFRYLLGSAGRQAMERLRIPGAHRDHLSRLGKLMGVGPVLPGAD